MYKEAYVVVQCDKCKTETKAELVAAVGLGSMVAKWSERNILSDLREQGWHQLDGEDYCPACFTKLK